MYRGVDNNYYLGAPFGMHRSPDGHTWSAIDGSPGGDGLIGDGKRIFTGFRNPPPDQQPYHVSPEGDGATWSALPSPSLPHGPVFLAYDPDHHVLYSANTESGLFRVVTQ